MSRAEAARINGAKSNGPKTEAGKAASSRNAVHYGLNASGVVMLGEDPDEYQNLLSEFVQMYNPQSFIEFELVNECVAARWRLRRIPVMEKAAWDAAMERSRNTPGDESLTDEQRYTKAVNEVTNGPEMKQVHRHETRLRRIWERARTELETLIGARLHAEREAEAAAYTAQLMADCKAQGEAIQAEWEAKQKRYPAQRQNQQPQPAPVQEENEPPAARAA